MAAKPHSRRGQVAIGFLVMVAGLGAAATAVSQLLSPPDKTVLDPVIGVIAGFAFVFGGAILVVPERRARNRALLGALMISAIALLFDWVAFGPGEHHVKSLGKHAVGSQLREMSRQILLASGAVLFNLMALWAWIRARRSAWTRSGKARAA